MHRIRFIRFILVVAAAGAILSCRTTRFQVDESTTQAEYFQRAQEAVEISDWDTALAYYEAFLERFSEDLPNVVAAEYEIAFIHYKKNDLTTAEEKFKSLISRYEDGLPPNVPQWPRVLSERLLTIIESEAS